jgi:hypothetical protein
VGLTRGGKRSILVSRAIRGHMKEKREAELNTS